MAHPHLIAKNSYPRAMEHPMETPNITVCVGGRGGDGGGGGWGGGSLHRARISELMTIAVKLSPLYPCRFTSKESHHNTGT